MGVNSDWGFYYNNKNSNSNKGYARANGQYADELKKCITGYTNGYTRNMQILITMVNLKIMARLEANGIMRIMTKRLLKFTPLAIMF